jgi:hypothetical protein
VNFGGFPVLFERTIHCCPGVKAIPAPDFHAVADGNAVAAGPKSTEVRVRACVQLAMFISLTVCVPTVGAATITVATAADLQNALVVARPADTGELAAGMTFGGNCTLPVKQGEAFITLQSSPDTRLPAQGVRIAPSNAPQLAKLRSPSGSPALQTAPGAHHWRIQLLEFQANAGGFGDIVTLGDGSTAQTSLTQVPHDLIVDRCYIHGDPVVGQKRGIALNSASTTISDSYIAEMKAVGQDSQAINGWNGPGPFVISDNYLEAAGENLLFGGTDPSIQNLVPSDITIIGNTFSRPTSWRGQQWQIKNILELKNARRVRIAGNLLENNWAAAQVGFAVLFTVRNQDGRCPWCQVAEVVFENNILQHSAAAISILGMDDSAKSEQTHAIVIRNNLLVDIDNEHWGGNGLAPSLWNTTPSCKTTPTGSCRCRALRSWASSLPTTSRGRTRTESSVRIVRRAAIRFLRISRRPP